MRYITYTVVFMGVFLLPTIPFAAGVISLSEFPISSNEPHYKPPAIQTAQLESILIRQGGDTIENAIPISLPFTSSGTTIGFFNDYDVSCPYISWCSDVVYSFLPTSDMSIVVDLIGSDYDTKVFILDSNFEHIACNDDYYENFVSLLQLVTLVGGTQYYIIVDGYDLPGNYQLKVVENQLDIPIEAIPEGEPTLFHGYIDEYNSGCVLDPDQPIIQELNANGSGNLDLHGHLGYIGLNEFGADSDWFSIVIGESGVVEVEFSAQVESKLYHFEPPNCQTAELVQSVTARFGHPGSMTIIGEPFSVVWLGAGIVFYPPSGYAEAEYSYLLSFSGLAPGTVATETLPWGEIKGRYR